MRVRVGGWLDWEIDDGGEKWFGELDLLDSPWPASQSSPSPS